jgi:DNA polymerase III gamma/tau subunit
MISILIKTKRDIKNSQNPVLITEMSLVKLTKLKDLVPVEDVISNIRDGKTQSQDQITSESANPLPQKKSEVQSIKKETPGETPKESEKTVKVTSLDMETVTAHESVLYKHIEKEKPVLGNYLRNNCKLQDVSKNRLYYNVNSSLAQKMLHENTSMISSVFKNYFGIEPRLEFTLKEEKKEEIISNPTLDDIRKKSPDLAEFIEATDSVIS